MGQGQSPNTHISAVILVLAPQARDTAATCEFLASAGLETRACTDIDGLCQALREAPRVVLVAEEALAGEALDRLAAVLAVQPGWCDIPVLVLMNARGGAQPDRRAIYLMEVLGNATLITRPVHPATLLSVARSAVRAHQRNRRLMENGAARPAATAPASGESYDDLRASGARFRAALKSAPVALFQQDRELRYVWIHNALCGRPPQDLIGRRDAELFADPDAIEAFKRDVIASGAGARGRFRLTSNGVTHHLDVAAEPFYDEHNAIIGLVGAAFAVDEYVELQERLRRQAEQLARMDQRKNEFIAQLAHELRNPLAPIHNAVHVLKIQPDPPDPAHVKWAIDVIGRQVLQLARLVDDMFDIARITHGQIRLRREVLELGQTVTQAIETARPLMAARQQAVIYRPPIAPLRVQADPGRLLQIVGNLLANAARYTPAGGHIEVTVQREGGDAVIAVADDGIGIAPDVLPHVFDPFYRGARAAAQGQAGLGLGLALVAQLTKLHGGTVEARSAGAGQGSTFVVRLPALADAPAASIPPPTVAAPATARRVLVVDDDADVAQSFALLLGLMRYDVRTAANAAAALEAARSFCPHVVFIDIGLPDMDGYALAREMRRLEDGATLHLIALTGSADADLRERAMAAGFDAHLLKPASAETVERLLASLETA